MAMLSPDERRRLQRYRRADDRGQHAVGWAIVRRALGLYLGVPPGSVVLDRSCATCDAQHGPPRLVQPAGDINLSISHAGDVVGVAFLRGRRIGLDIEVERGGFDYEELIDFACAPAERAALRRSGDAAPRAFLELWTQKEAVLKALGVGLGVAPQRLVIRGPRSSPAVVGWPGEIPQASRIALRPVTLDGAVCTVAVDGALPTVTRIDASRLIAA
ncbi:MAG TPA: 4'-phosphopantetheinyl transferase superfamily protein [Solirubrobacteraceae bacterium]|jgi:4'-phosphopantetheinyl transferase